MVRIITGLIIEEKVSGKSNMNLVEHFSYKTSFIFVYGAIDIFFYSKHSLIANHFLASR